MPPRRPLSLLLALLTAFAVGGCVMVGRSALPPPPPAAPPAPPRIEYALGDFTFQMNERDAIRSHFDARLIGAEIFGRWEDQGYVVAAERVDADAFSSAAAWHVTFSGRVHAESSFWAELLNALTLMVAPYPVTNHYDVQVSVQPAAGGAPMVATARTADQTWIGLLLLPALPFVERGHDEEMARLADALYAELRGQGAFAPQ